MHGGESGKVGKLAGGLRPLAVIQPKYSCLAIDYILQSAEAPVYSVE